jgi:hypothetical protein
MSHAFDQLSEISREFEYKSGSLSDPWIGSPFQWLLAIPSRSKGAYGEKFVSELFRVNGFTVLKPISGTDHDRVIEGHRIEIKLSTVWSKAPIFKFQQIRDQAYDYVLCIGIAPHSASCWVIPKWEFNVDKEGVAHQHGGVKGLDTMWLSFESARPPSWMYKYGGDLEDGIAFMRSLGTGDYSGKRLPAADIVLP